MDIEASSNSVLSDTDVGDPLAMFSILWGLVGSGGWMLLVGVEFYSWRDLRVGLVASLGFPCGFPSSVLSVSPTEAIVDFWKNP